MAAKTTTKMGALKNTLVMRLARVMVKRDNALRSAESAGYECNALCAKLVHGFPDEYNALYASAEQEADRLRSLA